MGRSEVKQCQQCNASYEITVDDQAFYNKIGVSSPTLCPDCRYQRRLANRNEWNFYKRNCTLCSKSMISLYNPEYTGPVYCIACWWSDDWDALEYGQDYDSNRSFFEQFKEVRFRVPKVTLAQVNSINSEYTNQSIDNKNCYMVVATGRSEDSLYGNWMVDVKQCVDCYAIENSELVYEALDCVNCYKSSYLEHCENCSNSAFLYDCRGCTDCFGSVGLRNKSYYWFNEPLTKEEYKKRLEAFEWTNDNIRATRQKVAELQRAYPHKYYNGRNNVASTGDYIEEAKESKHIFNGRHIEDIRYSQDAWYAKTSLDLTEVWENELDYELEGVGGSARSIALSKSTELFDAAYTDNCYTGEYLFGCISLRQKKYCILNKQYTKEAYTALREKIVANMKASGEWGEFMPVEVSAFAYNESVAQDYFPLTKDQVIERGWRWYDKPKQEHKIGGDIVACSNEVCVGVGAFRLHPAEVVFYQKMGLPTPEKCFPCRLKARLGLRNPRTLYDAQCHCKGQTSHNGVYTNNASIHQSHSYDQPCPNVFKTSYPPDSDTIVYCESCYQVEVL